MVRSAAYMARNGRVTLGLLIRLIILSGPLTACSTGSVDPPPSGYRAFGPRTYWNAPLPPDAPVDPNSAAIIAFLERDNSSNFVNLNGTQPTGEWGNPIYWAKPSDPSYRIANPCGTNQPPEFRSVRIPSGAQPDPTPDAEMTVYNLDRGLVFALWQARYVPGSDTWSACGGTVYYLASNGLAGSLAESDQPHNFGHRGVPPPAFSVRLDEIQAGAIDHVLKIAVNNTACAHVFPMVGDECGTPDPNAPPEGTRIRIRPSVDLRALGLSREALIIARALQSYGAVIGDQSKNRVNLKVENGVSEGRGWIWKDILREDSLAAIPLSDFEVVQLGFDPTG